MYGAHMVTFEEKTKEEYVKVSIPKEMRNEVERIIKSDKRLGFVSIQEFVKEAVRRSIIKYVEVYNKKNK